MMSPAPKKKKAGKRAPAAKKTAKRLPPENQRPKRKSPGATTKKPPTEKTPKVMETTHRSKSKAIEKKATGSDIPSGPWNPSIVVFACNWCSYAGADTAGVSRIQHQPHFRMIRVMCSGRIQPGFVLRAFEKGADGVLVSGCHFGDCHYVDGNERAVKQFEKTMNTIKLLGLEEGRLRLEWISAAEGVRFAQVINEFTDQVRALGPSRLATKSQAV